MQGQVGQIGQSSHDVFDILFSFLFAVYGSQDGCPVCAFTGLFRDLPSHST